MLVNNPSQPFIKINIDCPIGTLSKSSSNTAIYFDGEMADLRCLENIEYRVFLLQKGSISLKSIFHLV